ncbi:MAG: chemotaxis protein CheB, partial [Thermodesulfobacteriota bacterium]
QALELGAFDFVPKPEADSASKGLEAVRRELIPKLTFLHTRKTLRQVSGERPPKKTIPSVAPVARPIPRPAVAERITIRTGTRIKRRVVALGISTGGPRALGEMMVGLPKDLEAGLLIVQHMPPVFTQTLAQRLNEISPLETREAQDGDLVEPGVALVAPGGRHMVTLGEGRSKDQIRVRLNNDPPEHSCRPSADVLFRSVAEVYGAEAVGVIMTGMGFDGTEGLRLMRSKGAYIIAQNEETCTVYGMPKKVVEEGIAEEIVPLGEISAAIVRSVTTTGKTSA